MTRSQNERYRLLLLGDQNLTLHYNFARDKSLVASKGRGPTLDITRLTNASYFDSNGVMQTAPVNMVLQSQDFNVTWANVRTTDLQEQGIAPDGTNTANSISEDDGSATTHYIQQNVAYLTDVVYTLSMFVKASNRSWLLLQLPNNAFAASANAYFNVGTGAKGALGVGADSSVIEDVGNGWYRCSVTATADTGASGQTFMYVAEADLDVTFTGLTQESLLVWGAQIERGSSASTYVRTTTAKAGAPRFDHNPTTGESLGLLVEEARTNLCLQSENLATTWTNFNSVDTQAQGTAPDGTNTANKLIDDVGGETGEVAASQAITVATSSTFTVSVYAKADQVDWINLSMRSLGALSIYAYFDLTNGVVGTTTVGADNTSEFIEDVGNGWFRCGIVFASDAADSSGSMQIRPTESGGSLIVDLDGTSSVLLWGAQLEVGAFVTSYIPTATVSVTRNADLIVTTNTDWLNTAEGTMFASASSFGFNNSGFRVYHLSDGTSDEAIEVYSVATKILVSRLRTGASTVSTISSTEKTEHINYKTVHSWILNDIVGYSDGVQDDVDSSAAIPTGLDRLDIGGRLASTTNYLNGHIAEIRYYNVRKNNQFLEDLSNGKVNA